MRRRSLLGALLAFAAILLPAPPAHAAVLDRAPRHAAPSFELTSDDWGVQRAEDAERHGRRVNDVSVVADAVGAPDDPMAGAGVGIALIDSGLTPEFARSHPRVVVGPDFTHDGQLRDRYGHGTFLASLIVGGTGSSKSVRGTAPGATLISLEAAGADGTTDLETLTEAIGWVVEHRAEHNIRVLVLAVGIDPVGTYTDSLLSAALEVAWASGIVVVVPSGNHGADGLTHPGDDPWLLSVGAADTHGTSDLDDDTVAPWSGRSVTGGVSRPDVVAPGTSVVGARAPGSTVDRANPSARRGRGLFVGSGTSMASAIAAGGAAVVLQHHPAATPDDVKGALRDTARPLAGGGGMVDIEAAIDADPSPAWQQDHEIALDGLGGQLLEMPWAGVSWTGVSWTGVSWTGVSWTGVSWTGVSWTGVSWTGVSWTGVSWTGVSWTGVSWTGTGWATTKS